MNIDFLSLLDTISDDSFVDNVSLTSLLPDIDFDSLIEELTDVVDDVIAEIDQVVASVTTFVVDTLEELDIDSNVVDVSNIVEQIINFIENLPEDVTIADALGEISDFFSITLPSLSDAELEELLTDISELIDNIAPNLSQLSLTSILDQGAEFVGELIDGVGTITIDGDSLSGELTLDGLTRTFTTDLSDEIDNFLEGASDFLSGITGSASLREGQFTGDITIEDTQYQLSLDVTEALTDSLTNLLTTAEATLPFTDGVLSVDIDTVFGDVDGTIDFTGGDLDIGLTTPFGDVDTSISFPEDAQIALPVSFFGISETELDFAAGVLRTSFLNTPVEVSLDMFSGEFGLSEGVATLTLEDAFGSGLLIETTFEVGPLASQLASALTEDLSGEITIDAGEINGIVASAFGEFELLASFDDLLFQASSVIDETTGSLSLNSGLAAINLSTPFGDLAGAIALSTIEDGLADLSGLLA